jgi:hypothetical protein
MGRGDVGEGGGGRLAVADGVGLPHVGAEPSRLVRLAGGGGVRRRRRALLRPRGGGRGTVVSRCGPGRAPRVRQLLGRLESGSC